MMMSYVDMIDSYKKTTKQLAKEFNLDERELTEVFKLVYRSRHLRRKKHLQVMCKLKQVNDLLWSQRQVQIKKLGM